ncbi:hypothetical protein [Nocardia brevicatena]|uniref:hypothetical protein n=1 Tax=Nocardia brevicatena TaxID=37327 RepID=UPI0003101F40|nr:hypothetical protein [Nocardia brevicatena]
MSIRSLDGVGVLELGNDVTAPAGRAVVLDLARRADAWAARPLLGRDEATR